MQDTSPGPITQWLRLLIIQLFAFLGCYLFAAYKWTLDRPRRIGFGVATNGLEWHYRALEALIRNQNLSVAVWWHAVQQAYAAEFGSPFWLTVVAACAVVSTLVAGGYDRLAHSGNGSGASRWTSHYMALVFIGWLAFAVGGMYAALYSGHPALGQKLFLFAGNFLLVLLVVGSLARIITRCSKPRRPGAAHSDVRDVALSLATRKAFDPWQYIHVHKGCFVGLDECAKPVYIPWPTLNSTHVDFMGMTGTGKGVGSAVILGQCAMIDQAVIAFDPKGDSFMPGVLQAVAQKAGVPFRLIDLGHENPPQVNPFQGASVDQAHELMVAAFNLKPQGNTADIYKLEEQLCAQEVAQVARYGGLSMPAIHMRFEGRMMQARDAGRRDEVKGRRFWMDLLHLGTLQPIQTSQGPDLEECVNKPGITYIIGSLSDVRTVQTQKMLLFRFMQIITGGRARDRAPVCLMLDELKYLLSPQVLTLLSTVRDRNCHLVLAHQSLGDLEDSSELDGKAVRGAVVENTGLKLIYRVNSPETARWAAELSGKITAYTENQQMRTKLLENPGSWRETQRNLIEENTLLQLPKGLGVIYGLDGPARIVQICPLPEGSTPELTYRFAVEAPGDEATQLHQLAENIGRSALARPVQPVEASERSVAPPPAAGKDQPKGFF